MTLKTSSALKFIKSKSNTAVTLAKNDNLNMSDPVMDNEASVEYTGGEHGDLDTAGLIR